MCLNLSHKSWKRIAQRITNRGRRVNVEQVGPQVRQHFNSFAFHLWTFDDFGLASSAENKGSSTGETGSLDAFISTRVVD